MCSLSALCMAGDYLAARAHDGVLWWLENSNCPTAHFSSPGIKDKEIVFGGKLFPSRPTLLFYQLPNRERKMKLDPFRNFALVLQSLTSHSLFRGFLFLSSNDGFHLSQRHLCGKKYRATLHISLIINFHTAKIFEFCPPRFL